MKLTGHTPRQFADAQHALLPPGLAWEWPVDGFGDNLLLAMAQELVRIDAEAQPLADYAIDVHRPAAVGSTIYDYRKLVNTAFPGSIDSGVINLQHLLKSAVVGSKIGVALWSQGRIFYIHVRYNPALINQAALNAYLMSIKQAHISLYYEAI